ncbi:hypothetical protein H7U19_00045 [Hyunsoonleella sp. SJ7]|uniref:Uncharacterized protein n=1 Tax=Hyunsoonleella aquatilis TaxID=2762758 RepID=A0A923KHJ2_9FLAO|nr:hypothetical protein [Hyunsoonleella aquatilis]MBC3756774.1 hypothetical protein [Hyunsoonleella aquatilis]
MKAAIVDRAYDRAIVANTCVIVALCHTASVVSFNPAMQNFSTKCKMGLVTTLG